MMGKRKEPAAVKKITDLTDKLNAYRDVIADYGAIGDGVVDDTSAIQAAIDAASDGDTVLVQPDDIYKAAVALCAERAR